MSKHIADDWGWRQVVIAIQIDHVIQVTGTASFPQSTHFLTKDFRLVIAIDEKFFAWEIAVAVKHALARRRQNDHFISGQIELNLRKITPATGEVTGIVNTAFARFPAARIIIDIKYEAICRQFNTARLIKDTAGVKPK